MVKAPVKRKLPGKPRPAENFRHEYEDEVRQLLMSGGRDESQWTPEDRLRRAWGLLAPHAKEIFRWRVRFDLRLYRGAFHAGR